MSQKRQLHLGAVLRGAGGVGEHGVWRDAEVPVDASINIDYYIEQARLAEEAKFDLIFVVDSHYITPASPPHYLNRFEPFTVLSALATQTKNIGLVGTITTSFEEPFLVARRFASLDLISRGRAGWNVVTSGDEGTAKLFGISEHFDYEHRYTRAEEHVRLVQKLWDTYEDDAFPRNTTTGEFLNPEKFHPVNHQGRHFQLEGPLNISRSQQGQPVIFQAGDSEFGRNLGGSIGEGIFTHQATLQGAKAFREDIRNRALQHGRNPNHLIIMPGIDVVVGDTDAQARELEKEIHQQDADFDKSLKQFGRSFGWHDFTQYDLDAPFPDLTGLGDNSFKTRADAVRSRAREHGLTLRQVIEEFGTPQPSPFVGSPETVANLIQEWFENGGVDGFNIHYRTHRQFKRFTNEVLPILRSRSIVRSDYESSTLRGNLGLPVPENQNTANTRLAQQVFV